MHDEDPSLEQYELGQGKSRKLRLCYDVNQEISESALFQHESYLAFIQTIWRKDWHSGTHA